MAAARSMTFGWLRLRFGRSFAIMKQIGTSKREPEFAVVSMELITERCMIRNMKMEDANDLYQVLSDASVMMYVEQAFDIERVNSFIQLAGLCKPPLVYAIVWKMTGTVIGHAIFHCYEKNDYEIGWILNRNYWGIEIADEVTKELIKCAGYLGAESCVIECDERQIASKKIAIKNGFVYEDKSGRLERYRLMLGSENSNLPNPWCKSCAAIIKE